MDILVFVMNNSGVYRGDANTAENWHERRRNTVAGTTTKGEGLTAWSLGYVFMREDRYIILLGN